MRTKDVRVTPRFATIACLLLLVAAANAARASDADVSVAIEWNPAQDLPENALWLAYLTARAAYIDENKTAYDPKRSVTTPLFAEELVARTEVRNAPKQGEQVSLRPRAEEAHLFDPESGQRLAVRKE